MSTFFDRFSSSFQQLRDGYSKRPINSLFTNAPDDIDLRQSILVLVRVYEECGDPETLFSSL